MNSRSYTAVANMVMVEDHPCWSSPSVGVEKPLREREKKDLLGGALVCFFFFFLAMICKVLQEILGLKASATGTISCTFSLSRASSIKFS